MPDEREELMKRDQELGEAIQNLTETLRYVQYQLLRLNTEKSQLDTQRKEILSRG